MSRGPFIGLAVAEVFSITGSRLSQIALPWLVLNLTGSATWTGFAGFLVMLPYVALKALGGPIVDRVGPKVVAVTCDSLSVVVIGMVPLLHWLGLLPLPMLLCFAVVMGALRGPSDGAKSAMVPSVAKHADVPLERVTGVLGTIDRLGSSLGSAFAGGLVALVGAADALAIDAVGLGIAALLISRFIPRDKPAPTGDSEPYFASLAAGWRYLRGDAVLTGICMMVAVTNLLDQGYSAVLVPVWAKEHGHSIEIVGLVLAVMSGAAIGGAALATVLAHRMPRMAVYTVAFLLTGLPRYVALGSGWSVAWVCVVLVIGGFASGFINPILSAVIFERIPEALVGRVSALNTALCWALIPFGGLVAGTLVTVTNISVALWVFGLVYFGATLLPLLHKGFRQFSERPTASASKPTVPAH